MPFEIVGDAGVRTIVLDGFLVSALKHNPRVVYLTTDCDWEIKPDGSKVQTIHHAKIWTSFGRPSYLDEDLLDIINKRLLKAVRDDDYISE